MSSDALAVDHSADGLEKLSLTRIWPNFWTDQIDISLCCRGSSVMLSDTLAVSTSDGLEKQLDMGLATLLDSFNDITWCCS